MRDESPSHLVAIKPSSFQVNEFTKKKPCGRCEFSCRIIQVLHFFQHQCILWSSTDPLIFFWITYPHIEWVQGHGNRWHTQHTILIFLSTFVLKCSTSDPPGWYCPASLTQYKTTLSWEFEPHMKSEHCYSSSQPQHLYILLLEL